MTSYYGLPHTFVRVTMLCYLLYMHFSGVYGMECWRWRRKRGWRK